MVKLIVNVLRPSSKSLETFAYNKKLNAFRTYKRLIEKYLNYFYVNDLTKYTIVSCKIFTEYQGVY